MTYIFLYNLFLILFQKEKENKASYQYWNISINQIGDEKTKSDTILPLHRSFWLWSLMTFEDMILKWSSCNSIFSTNWKNCIKLLFKLCNLDINFCHFSNANHWRCYQCNHLCNHLSCIMWQISLTIIEMTLSNLYS